MRFMSVRITLLAALCIIMAPSVRAASLADFNTAVEIAASHNRVALGYLRTGNTDLAMLEIERLQTAWSAVMGRFAKDRPDVFEPSLYATTVTDINTRLAAADMFLRSGRPEAAATSLSGVRDALSNLRLRSGVTVLADCVLEANARMRALGALDRPPLDWATPQTASQLTGQAKLYRQHLERCDAMAPAAVKETPEFRRLIDGALASLALVPKAVETRDDDLFHRIVIELEAFNNLLSFRFG